MSKIDFIVSELSPILKEPGRSAFFLSPCFHYNLSNAGLLADYESVSVSRHLDQSRQQIIDEDKEIDRRVERYLAILSERLNELHGRNYSLDFWRKVISIPMDRYVKMTYEFYHACANSFDPQIHRAQIIQPEQVKIPETFIEQRDFLQHSPLADEILFGLFCRMQGLTHIETASAPPVSSPPTGRLGLLVKKILFKGTILKSLTNRIYLWLTKFFYAKRPVEVGLVGTLFEPRETRALIRRSKGAIDYLYGQVPKFNLHNMPIDDALRHRLSRPIENADAFDDFFCASLTLFFPIAFLEAFGRIEEKLIRWSDRFPTMKFAVSEVWPSDSINALLLALLQHRHDIRHIYNEHNYLEHYYIGDLITKSVALCDIFASLGWSDEKFSNLVVGGSLYDLGTESENEIEHDILFVSGAFLAKAPQVSTSYGFAGGAALASIEITNGFLNALSPDTKKHIYFKDYPAIRIRDNLIFKTENDPAFPISDLKAFDQSNANAVDLISRSRLLITNYLSTTHIQSLMMNKPTLILRAPGTYELNERYKEFYDALVEAKIMHDDAQSAAAFVETIYRDPSAWWQSDIVQGASRKFIEDNFGGKDALPAYLMSLTKASKN